MSKEKNERSYLIALLFLVLSGFFVYLFLLPEDLKTQDQKANEAAQRFEKKVNRHLFQTSQQMELDREKARLEANKLVQKGIKVAPGIDPQKTAHPLDLSVDPRDESLPQVLDRDSKNAGLPAGPNDLIQAELFQEQQLQAYTEEYKKAYAQQFIENARKAGYLVKLNDQYKVIQVTPIRKPSQYDLFHSDSSAVR